MPGTISVSVLEFMGLPSSSSSISIKVVQFNANAVSLGKREYIDTWQKGDFSFPLTTLRDNLIVLLQDSEGNEISNAVVETKLIVEKGLWDDLFPLKGGGHVHLKLQFLLNEDERNRIRAMRELALKKKHGEVVLRSRTDNVERSTNDVSNVVPFYPFSPKISDENQDTSSAISKSQRIDVHLNESRHRKLISKVEAQSDPTKIVSGVNFTNDQTATNPLNSSLQTDKTNFLERKDPQKRPTNNVMKMISAFESGLTQDMKSESMLELTNLKSSKLHLQGKEADQKGEHKTVVSAVKVDRWNISQIKGPSISTKNKVKPVHKELDTKDEMPQEDLMITTTISPHTSHVASTMLDQSTCENRKSFRSRQSSAGHVTIEESGMTQNLTIQEASTHNLNSVSYCEVMDNIHQSSGLWIFPDQTRRFCITTGGRKVMNDLPGGHIYNLNMNGAELNFPIQETLQPNDNGETSLELNTNNNKIKSSRHKIEDVEASGGSIRQVIKVAIMVGFGVLVLFTRQKTYR